MHVYVHPKNSNPIRSHSRAIMALDHKTIQAEFFALDKFTLPNLANKSGGV